MRLIRDREVRAALISGLIIAAMAMIGADRYPVAFAVVATLWVVVTTATVVHTTRRADRSPGTGAGRSHDHDDDLPGQDVVDMSAHTVRAKRWSGGWELHIGDVGVAQSRTLATAERQVRIAQLALPDARAILGNLE